MRMKRMGDPGRQAKAVAGYQHATVLYEADRGDFNDAEAQFREAKEEIEAAKRMCCRNPAEANCDPAQANCSADESDERDG
jgi:hypothetical protein